MKVEQNCKQAVVQLLSVQEDLEKSKQSEKRASDEMVQLQCVATKTKKDMRDLQRQCDRVMVNAEKKLMMSRECQQKKFHVHKNG